MNALIVNCGSSSIKIMVINTDNFLASSEARAEHIGSTSATITFKTTDIKKVLKYESGNLTHEIALKEIINYLISNKIISSLDEIDFVGHRVVHGGNYFSEPVIITYDVIKKISDCRDLAPFHNPVSIEGINTCMNLLPNIPHIAVFDTAFHQTIPEINHRYAISDELYNKGVRKYGFHGTSYSYLTRCLSNSIGTNNIYAVMVHAGNGTSVCAVRKGKSVWTSMEFSTLTGCVMVERSGNIDPAVIQYICKLYNCSVDTVLKLLNKKSGLLSISGKNNMLEILDGVQKNESKCIFAIDMFCKSIAENMSKAILALGGQPKQIVFTGGIGENSCLIRNNILEKLSPIAPNIFINDKENKNNSNVISTSYSNTDIYVIPAGEEQEIARIASKLII